MKKSNINPLQSHYLIFGNPASKLAPQKGYYLIKEIITAKFEEKPYDFLCIAIWHPHSFFFETSLKVRVQFKFLYNNSNDGPINFDFIDLKKLVINIKDIKLIDKYYNDEDYKAYKLTWDFIDISIPETKEKLAKTESTNEIAEFEDEEEEIEQLVFDEQQSQNHLKNCENELYQLIFDAQQSEILEDYHQLLDQEEAN